MSSHLSCHCCGLWAARRSFLRLTAVAAASTLAACATNTVLPEDARVKTSRHDSIFSLPPLLPASMVEGQSAQGYVQMMNDAGQKRVLVHPKDPQLQNLNRILNRLMPHALKWNKRASEWQWEVNLIKSDELNAFCMPGGKIAFYTGIINKLKLNNDEIAMIMGHEMSHALLEHGNSQLSKSLIAKFGLKALEKGAGVGAAEIGAQVWKLFDLSFSRDDETDADRVGLELAARAGFNPEAAVTFWTKMQKASGGGGETQLAFLSTHPSNESRIADLRANIVNVQDLYLATQPKSAPRNKKKK